MALRRLSDNQQQHVNQLLDKSRTLTPKQQRITGSGITGQDLYKYGFNLLPHLNQTASDRAAHYQSGGQSDDVFRGTSGIGDVGQAGTRIGYSTKQGVQAGGTVFDNAQKAQEQRSLATGQTGSGQENLAGDMGSTLGQGTVSYDDWKTDYDQKMTQPAYQDYMGNLTDLGYEFDLMGDQQQADTTQQPVQETPATSGDPWANIDLSDGMSNEEMQQAFDAGANPQEILQRLQEWNAQNQVGQVQDPIVQDPVVQDPIVQDPIVQDPVVQDPVVQDPAQDTMIPDPMPEPSPDLPGSPDPAGPPESHKWLDSWWTEDDIKGFTGNKMPHVLSGPGDTDLNKVLLAKGLPDNVYLGSLIKQQAPSFVNDIKGGRFDSVFNNWVNKYGVSREHVEEIKRSVSIDSAYYEMPRHVFNSYKRQIEKGAEQLVHPTSWGSIRIPKTTFKWKQYNGPQVMWAVHDPNDQNDPRNDPNNWEDVQITLDSIKIPGTQYINVKADFSREMRDWFAGILATEGVQDPNQDPGDGGYGEDGLPTGQDPISGPVEEAVSQDPVSGPVEGPVSQDPISGPVEGPVSQDPVSGPIEGPVSQDPVSGPIEGTPRETYDQELEADAPYVTKEANSVSDGTYRPKGEGLVEGPGERTTLDGATSPSQNLGFSAAAGSEPQVQAESPQDIANRTGRAVWDEETQSTWHPSTQWRPEDADVSAFQDPILNDPNAKPIQKLDFLLNAASQNPRATDLSFKQGVIDRDNPWDNVDPQLRREIWANRGDHKLRDKLLRQATAHAKDSDYTVMFLSEHAVRHWTDIRSLNERGLKPGFDLYVVDKRKALYDLATLYKIIGESTKLKGKSKAWIRIPQVLGEWPNGNSVGKAGEQMWLNSEYYGRWRNHIAEKMMNIANGDPKWLRYLANFNPANHPVHGDYTPKMPWEKGYGSEEKRFQNQPMLGDQLTQQQIAQDSQATTATPERPYGQEQEVAATNLSGPTEAAPAENVSGQVADTGGQVVSGFAPNHFAAAPQQAAPQQAAPREDDEIAQQINAKISRGELAPLALLQYIKSGTIPAGIAGAEGEAASPTASSPSAVGTLPHVGNVNDDPAARDFFRMQERKKYWEDQRRKQEREIIDSMLLSDYGFTRGADGTLSPPSGYSYEEFPIFSWGMDPSESRSAQGNWYRDILERGGRLLPGGGVNASSWLVPDTLPEGFELSEEAQRYIDHLNSPRNQYGQIVGDIGDSTFDAINDPFTRKYEWFDHFDDTDDWYRGEWREKPLRPDFSDFEPLTKEEMESLYGTPRNQRTPSKEELAEFFANRNKKKSILDHPDLKAIDFENMIREGYTGAQVGRTLNDLLSPDQQEYARRLGLTEDTFKMGDEDVKGFWEDQWSSFVPEADAHGNVIYWGGSDNDEPLITKRNSLLGLFEALPNFRQHLAHASAMPEGLAYDKFGDVLKYPGRYTTISNSPIVDGQQMGWEDWYSQIKDLPRTIDSDAYKQALKDYTISDEFGRFANPTGEQNIPGLFEAMGTKPSYDDAVTQEDRDLIDRYSDPSTIRPAVNAGIAEDAMWGKREMGQDVYDALMGMDESAWSLAATPLSEMNESQRAALGWMDLDGNGYRDLNDDRIAYNKFLHSQMGAYGSEGGFMGGGPMDSNDWVKALGSGYMPTEADMKAYQEAVAAWREDVGPKVRDFDWSAVQDPNKKKGYRKEGWQDTEEGQRLAKEYHALSVMPQHIRDMLNKNPYVSQPNMVQNWALDYMGGSPEWANLLEMSGATPEQKRKWLEEQGTRLSRGQSPLWNALTG